MSKGDYIQLAIFMVLTISLLLLGWQTVLQNRLLRAQLLKDRYEMYWRTYDPVSDQQVDELVLHPDDYMDQSLYDERYKGEDRRIRRYIYMSVLYEYLAFTHSLRRLKIPDPLGDQWLDNWTRELILVEEFQNVHKQYRSYYPHFESFVDDLLKSTKRMTT